MKTIVAAEARAGSGTVLGDTALQSETLEGVATAVRYHDWLASLALPHLGDDPVEVGSGLGDYAMRWLDLGVPRITLTEADASRLQRLSDRFLDEPRVKVRFLDLASDDALTSAGAQHSSVVMINVLEHLHDDVRGLRSAARMVRPGGHVVLLVPAFPFAMSRFDRAVGHVRRYTVESLTDTIARSGLRLENAHYVNLPGLPAWFVGMRLLRMTPGEGPLLSIWDRYVIPRARLWEHRHRPPFGQSVFAVGRMAAR